MPNCAQYHKANSVHITPLFLIYTKDFYNQNLGTLRIDFFSLLGLFNYIFCAIIIIFKNSDNMYVTTT